MGKKEMVVGKGYEVVYKRYRENGSHSEATMRGQLMQGSSIFGDLVFNHRPWNEGGTGYLMNDQVIRFREIPVPARRP